MNNAYTIADALTEAYHRLQRTSDSAQLDSQLLLAHILEQPRPYLYTYPEKRLSSEQSHTFNALLARRLQGEPIAYILNTREFWSLPLTVTRDTLIPRVETERLVEFALEKLPQTDTLTVADLGTGSGAIALAIAKERPHWMIYATDASLAALNVAKHNAKQLNIRNIQFLQSNWYTDLPQVKFNAIVSNPPYIAEQDPHLQQGDLRYEPQSALISGEEGLRDIALLIQQAPRYLKPTGYLMLEHGHTQAEKVMHLFEAEGYSFFEDYSDFAGLPRIAIGQSPLQKG